MLTFDKRMPSYFEALNLVDLDEIIEEEIVLNEDFHTRIMTKAVFQRAQKILQRRQESGEVADDGTRITVSGESYYQPHKVFENWLKFNSTNQAEEQNIKLLLNMPLLPFGAAQKRVNLVHPYQKFYLKS